MSVINDDSSVKIAVRECPLREIFKNNGVPSAISYHSSNSNILIADERPFAFDHVLSPSVSQDELFNLLLQPLVDRVLQGFHCTALAYGQTGTGKSFTMGLNPETLEGVNVGMIPRCLRAVLESKPKDDMVKHEILVSFIEIYSEKVFDLLSETPSKAIIARGYKFTGGTKKSIQTTEDGYNLLHQGTKNRHVRPTKMNPQSSRSHAIFTIYVHKQVQNKITKSCLNLVDLAGSEGVRRTGHQGVALSEGVHINQGLLSIGKVLQAITHGYKVIPYRDSVLSSVLQDSLNTNSYFTLLACISPHREDLSETLSTLRFAQSAKNLKNNPQINSKLMESKRSKTPYKPCPFRPRQTTAATPMSCKRPFSLANLPPTESKRQPTLHANTFCTPNKKRKTENLIVNRTVVGMTPKEKQKIGSVQMPISKVVPFSFESSVRESINQDPFNDLDLHNSHGSVTSLNISSSTTIDTIPVVQKHNINTISSSTYSPLVRKCVAEVQSTFKSSMSQFLESLKSTQKPLFNSSPLSTERQQIRSIIRQELFTLASERKTEAIKDLAINRELFFDQSSSDFKTPLVPVDSSSSCIPVDFTRTEDGHSFSTEQTVLPATSTATKSLGRSRRLSQRCQSMDGNVAAVAPRRRSMRLSIKSLHNARRRNTQLFSHKEDPREEDEEEEDLKPQPSKTVKKKPNKSVSSKPETLIKNPTIASYFTEKENKKPTSVKSNLAKHKKAILEILNAGTMKELQCLPQVGLKTAFQIITQRTLLGKFKSLNDVAKLPIWRGSAWERFKEANSIL